MRVITVVAVLTLAGCSSAGGGTGQVQGPGAGATASGDGDDALFVQSDVEKPTCNATTKGRIVYVAESKQLEACDGSKWGPVDVDGGRIVASIHCAGVIPDGGTYLTYAASVTQSGDVYVIGSVVGAAFETSRAAFWSAKQNGAATAAVIITADVFGTYNGGFWTLSLDRSTLVHSATYEDEDLAGGKKTWTMTPDKCIKNVY